MMPLFSRGPQRVTTVISHGDRMGVCLTHTTAKTPSNFTSYTECLTICLGKNTTSQLMVMHLETKADFALWLHLQSHFSTHNIERNPALVGGLSTDRSLDQHYMQLCVLCSEKTWHGSIQGMLEIPEEQVSIPSSY